jgi:hypothetical protein
MEKMEKDKEKMELKDKKTLALIESEFDGYPKAKAYVEQLYLLFPVGDVLIQKMINGKSTIEATLTDYAEYDIKFAIKQCFKFNKGRPTTNQVVAVLTGDKEEETKKRELEQSKSEQSHFELFNRVKGEYDELIKLSLSTYLTRHNQIRKTIYDNYGICTLKVLDELMENFIQMQARALTFRVKNMDGIGLPLSKHFHFISSVNGELASYPRKCFTTFLRSSFFEEKVKQKGKLSINIPTSFIEYIETNFKKQTQEQTPFEDLKKQIGYEEWRDLKSKWYDEDFDNVIGA